MYNQNSLRPAREKQSIPRTRRVEPEKEREKIVRGVRRRGWNEEMKRVRVRRVMRRGLPGVDGRRELGARQRTREG